MSALAILGFVTVIALVVLLLRGRVDVPVILILLPTVIALIVGLFINHLGLLETIQALQGYMTDGLATVSNTVALFAFAILYFNILGDAGMFDAIVSKIMKYIGNNISVILAMTCFVATISHLDGSGATTMLITIPMMLPLFKKMNINPLTLVLYVGLISGTVNLMPWMSALARVSSATGVDVQTIYQGIMPAQMFALVVLYGSCFVVGPILKKRGCGMSDEEFAILKSGMLKPAEPVLKISRGVLIFDILMTVFLIVAMLFRWLNTNLAFMLGLCVVLVINCKDSKQMREQLVKHGGRALQMIVSLLAVGLLSGVMKGTGMIEAMTQTLLQIIPSSMGIHLMFIIALIGLPMSMVLADAVYLVMTPIFMELAISFGGEPVSACVAVLIGGCISANLCLVGATPYLGLGLAGGLEMRDALKHNFLPSWALSIGMAVFSLIIGVL